MKAAILLAETMDQKRIRPLISQEQIAKKIKEVSHKIEKDYEGKHLVVVMVLKGAICLVADMIREIDLPLDLETVQCSSYGSGGEVRGKLQVIGAEDLNVEGRDVLVVDDIFDSGQTMKTLLETIQEKSPTSLKSCVLLYKHGVPKVCDYRPDYVLFDIENQFVVGYGLDFKERYRGLSGVFVLDPL